MAEPIRVLYLEGDAAAPRYVRNILSQDGFVLLEGLHHISESLDVDVCILSDLPLTRLGAANEEWLVERVQQGMGLLVVGGWSSFGRGLYAGSRLAEHLPVRVETSDDRQNLYAGAALVPAADDPLVEGLTFDPPPMIAGYNRIRARRGAKVVLEARRVTRREANSLRLSEDADPILVLSETTGRVAALATDLAPHWSGGLTDWGEQTVRFADGTEVGPQYVDFVQRIVAWCAGRQLLATSTLMTN